MMNFLPSGLRLAGYIAAGLAALWALWFVYDLLTATNKVKAKLGENTTEAAIESGKDAVNSTGDQAAKENELKDKTEEMKNELDKTDNADDAHGVGSSFLCDTFDICAEE